LSGRVYIAGGGGYEPTKRKANRKNSRNVVNGNGKRQHLKGGVAVIIRTTSKKKKLP